MIDIECSGFFCFSDTIAEQDLSDLIVPPPQCEFVLIFFFWPQLVVFVFLFLNLKI